MFREMRRKRQALLPEEIQAVLNRGTSGVLALSGDNDYPYAVPISYVYDGEKIYFHCAKSGHKLDAVRRNRKASFCVIDQDRIIPEEYTSYFRSVIVFGYKCQYINEQKIKNKNVQKRELCNLSRFIFYFFYFIFYSIGSACNINNMRMMQ